MRFVTDEFKPYTEATIGASFMSKQVSIPIQPIHSDEINNNDTKEESQSTPLRHVGFKIWDTAGQEKYRSLAPMYYRGSQAAILVYDITKPGSFTALKDWVCELKNNAPPDLVLAVCGNKSDLELDRIVGRSTAEKYAHSIGAIYIEASAKNGDQVERLFEDVAKQVPPESPDYLLEEDGLDLGKSSQPSSGCC